MNFNFNFEMKKLVQFLVFLPLVVLPFVAAPMVSQAETQIQDQFNHDANWPAFQSVPKVLVLQGRGVKDKTEGQKWGVFLQQKFNSNFSPSADTVTVLSPQEHVKVLAVATLPNMPDFAKGMVRNRFKSDSPNYGVLLDFSSVLSSQFGFNEQEPLPAVVIIPIYRPDGTTPPAEVIRGSAMDDGVRAQVEKAVARALTHQLN